MHRIVALLVSILAACSRSEIRVVGAAAETAAMPSVEDAADDPAIWVNGADPARSRVLGTDKQTGLYVFDLSGALVQSLPIGALNNVDLRQSAGAFDFAVASNDARNVVSVFTIARDTGVVAHRGEFATAKVEPYGICVGVRDDVLIAIVTYKDGLAQVFEFAAASVPVEGAGLADIPATLARTAKFDSQLEGCVIDEAQDRVFVGEEAGRLWSMSLSEAAAPTLVAEVGDASALAADVEGVSLWRGLNGEGWLIVSAQGKNRFAVYDRAPPHAPRGAFRVAATRLPSGARIDGVSGTDGLDVVAANVGENYPRGLLVVQDDVNTSPRANQNFKLIDWREVEKALALSALAPEQP